MTRFFGKIGYESAPVEIVEGVWSAPIIERDYYGYIPRQAKGSNSSDKVNEDIQLQDRISVVADAELLENYTLIKYVMRAGSRWEVTSVEVARPRLILSLGGAYDGRIP